MIGPFFHFILNSKDIPSFSYGKFRTIEHSMTTIYNLLTKNNCRICLVHSMQVFSHLLVFINPLVFWTFGYLQKNAMIGGALSGVLISGASNNHKDKIIKDAITAGAVATAVEFINYLT